MKPLLIFQFDKIVEICPKKVPVTMREICFRSLPNAYFIPRAEDLLKTANNLNFKTMLIAYENEILVKESLMSLKACRYFDNILIVDEYIKNNASPEVFADMFILEHHGTDVVRVNSLDFNLFNYLSEGIS